MNPLVSRLSGQIADLREIARSASVAAMVISAVSSASPHRTAGTTGPTVNQEHCLPPWRPERSQLNWATHEIRSMAVRRSPHTPRYGAVRPAGRSGTRRWRLHTGRWHTHEARILRDGSWPAASGSCPRSCRCCRVRAPGIAASVTGNFGAILRELPSASVGHRGGSACSRLPSAGDRTRSSHPTGWRRERAPAPRAEIQALPDQSVPVALGCLQPGRQTQWLGGQPTSTWHRPQRSAPSVEITSTPAERLTVSLAGPSSRNVATDLATCSRRSASARRCPARERRDPRRRQG